MKILDVLAETVRKEIKEEGIKYGQFQEIRLREGKQICVKCNGKYTFYNHIISREEIKETLNYIANYSLYAYENELSQGFLTMEGGHRVGVSGKVIIENGKVKNFQYITGLNIRVSHEVKGCANVLFPYILDNQKVVHTMIISPPGCGKTTLLRDLVRQLSDGNKYLKGVPVSVVDERSEIAGCFLGVPQNDLGRQADVLDNCPKAEGMIMAIRSLSPKILAVDEIGTPEDVECISYVIHSGVSMLATVHGYSLEELKEKPLLKQLIHQKVFKRYILLGNRPGTIVGIYNEEGEMV